MTKEEKNLLLQDLCARLPYGVKATTTSNLWSDTYIVSGYADNRIYLDCPVYDEGDNEWLVEFVKPYLRPLSSMTKEEKREFQNILSNNKNGVWLEHSKVYDEKYEIGVDSYYPYIPLNGFTNGFNWLNKKMFDYRGLIPIGLALPAPDGMYNQKNE